jgi:hypothetical protein
MNAPPFGEGAFQLLRESWTRESLREILSRHPARPLLPRVGSEAWCVAAQTICPKTCRPLRALAEVNGTNRFRF